MPIRPEDRDRYPDDWKAISARIRFERAANLCECRGECGDDHDGRCAAPNGQYIARLRSNPARFLLQYDNPTCMDDGECAPAIKVVLTVAHLDHTPENCDDANLLAMCQRCHLRMDRDHHARTRRRTRDAKSGQGGLFPEPEARQP